MIDGLSPYTRVMLRYLIGYFVAKGILPEDLANMISEDPWVHELLDFAIAGAIGLAVEGWYALAKKMGWKT